MLSRSYRDGTTGRVPGPDGDASWFATGDAGRFEENGNLAVAGRIDDVITTGAEKVWPDVVERVLSANPNVAEVAVWKRSDPEWGEQRRGLGRAEGRCPFLGGAPQGRRRHDRTVGGTQGARHRRRPAADRVGKVSRRALL